MNILKQGDQLVVTIEGIEFSRDGVKLLASDAYNTMYELTIAPDVTTPPGRRLGAPESDYHENRPTDADTPAATPPEQREQPGNEPEGSPMAALARARGGIRRPGTTVEPKLISDWLVDHPSDFKYYRRRCSLRRRQLIAQGLRDVLGDSFTNEAYSSMIAIDPEPSLEEAHESGRGAWGRSESAPELHGGKHMQLLQNEPSQRGKVDPGMARLTYVPPNQGNSVDPVVAAETIKEWADLALK